MLDGALGTPEALAIVPKVAEKIKGFGGKVIFTRDTHGEDYLDTQEGRLLPVRHCIKGTDGWQIRAELEALGAEDVIDKPAFGSPELAMQLKNYDETVEHIGSVTLVGLCTDICVISNAMLIKAFMPEVKVTDLRAANPGWSLTGQVTDLTSGAHTIDGKQFGWR